MPRYGTSAKKTVGRAMHKLKKASMNSRKGDKRVKSRQAIAIGLSETRRKGAKVANPAKNTICLWYDGDAEDAARFYAKTFPDSSVGRGAYGTGRLSFRQERGCADGRVYRDGNSLPRAQWRTRVQAQYSILISGRNRRPGRNRSLLERDRQATAARRVNAAGAKTNGGYPGRLRRWL